MARPPRRAALFAFERALLATRRPDDELVFEAWIGVCRLPPPATACRHRLL